jgi:hypothetical protein
MADFDDFEVARSVYRASFGLVRLLPLDLGWTRSLRKQFRPASIHAIIVPTSIKPGRMPSLRLSSRRCDGGNQNAPKSLAFRGCSPGSQIRDFSGGSDDPEVYADRVRKKRQQRMPTVRMAALSSSDV